MIKKIAYNILISIIFSTIFIINLKIFATENVNTWDILSATSWNNIINSIFWKNVWSWKIVYTWWNVWIWTSNPTAKFELAWSAKIFWTTETKNITTIYQASTDWFLIWYASINSSSATNISIYSDSNSNPWTLIQRSWKETWTMPQYYTTFNVPIKKWDYYKVITEWSPSVVLYRIPIWN